MKHFLNSKTNVIGCFLLVVSIPMAIVLKGNFGEWGMFAGLVFGAITGRNINKTIQEKNDNGIKPIAQ